MWLDWLWWILGGVCGALGLYTVWRAMFSDRARGRRRCPSCWYDLAGLVDLRCPECGRTVRNQKQLARTRRHWKRAAAGVLLLIGCLALLEGREASRYGWVKATPTWCYILFLPSLDVNTTFAELHDRAGQGVLRQVEYRLLVHRAVGVLRNSRSDAPTLTRMAMLLTTIEFGGQNRRKYMPWGSWLAATDVDQRGTIDALAGLLQHQDPQVHGTALDALFQFNKRAVSALPAMMGETASDNATVATKADMALGFLTSGSKIRLSRMNSMSAMHGQSKPPLKPSSLEFYRSLGKCGTDIDRARPILEAGLKDEDAAVRSDAVFGLELLFSGDPDLHHRILQNASESDPTVWPAVVNAAAVMPLDSEVLAMLRHELHCDEGRTNNALVAIQAHEKNAAEFLNDVKAVMQSHGWAAEQAAQCFVAIGGDPNVAVEAMLERLSSIVGRHDSTEDEKADSIDALGEMNVNSPKACEVLYQMLHDTSSGIRSAAAVAYVKLGGEDLDAATRTAFESMAKPSRANMEFSRWFWLARTGRVSENYLRELLADEQAANRANSVRFLGMSGRPATPLLSSMRPLKSDVDPTVRQWADWAVKRVEYIADHPEFRESRDDEE